MKLKLCYLMLALVATGVLGCASAGPVVTNVSYDAGGALSIEKCKVHSNFFLGTMELEQCSNHTIKIK